MFIEEQKVYTIIQAKAELSRRKYIQHCPIKYWSREFRKAFGNLFMEAFKMCFL